MLSYAFKELKQNNYESMAKEEFERVLDLFAEILFKGVSMQLKQGLYREYVEKHESLSTLKGHIDINETIRNRIQRKHLLACDYDELSENNLLNQILKSTILKLVRCAEVDKKRKSQLLKLLPFFADVADINLKNVRWSTLTFQRNNQSYKMLMNLCYFISTEILMTTERGDYKMATFSDENMSRLYERFILEYYRAEHEELKVNSEKIDWNITEKDSLIKFLPTMQSDITLSKGNKTLIIDAKYYSRMTQQNFEVHESGPVLTSAVYIHTEYTRNCLVINTTHVY